MRIERLSVLLTLVISKSPDNFMTLGVAAGIGWWNRRFCPCRLVAMRDWCHWRLTGAIHASSPPPRVAV